jgi:hypothetical protein
VRVLAAEHHRFGSSGVDVVRLPRQEPWGLLEMWIAGQDGWIVPV